MMWELYQTKHPGLGTVCEVYLSVDGRYIKRIFKKDAITVSGKKTRFSDKTIQLFFENEVYWLKKLDGEFLPELFEIDAKERSIVQGRTDTSLLDYKPILLKKIPDVEEQIIEMYRFFRKEKVFKRNGSLSNLTLKNNKVLAFDFKWAMRRPFGIGKELFSYDHYLYKINRKLPHRLKELL